MNVVRLLGRGRWLAALALAAVITIGTAAALAAANIAHRTETAYERYLADADVSPLVLNPSLATSDIDAAIRSLPGVEAAYADDFLLATLDDGRPRRSTAIQNEITTQARSSPDGRYVDVDRPAIAEGRLPTGRREAFLSTETARARELAVGDTTPIAFWPGTSAYDPSGVTVRPVGVETVTVVGTGVLADEVLADDLYPRERVIVSPDVARAVTCNPVNPGRDVDAASAFAALMPPDCALLYRYYSLQLDDRPGALARAMAAFSTRAEALDRELADAVRADDYGYFAIPTTTADEQARIDRALGPSVTIAAIFAVAAGITTLVLGALIAARGLRRRHDDVAIWQTLGVTRLTRAAALALPVGGAVIVGVLAAVAVAWPLTTVGPLGVVHAIEPDPGPALTGWLTLLVAVGMLGLLGVAVAALGWRAALVRVSLPRRGVRRSVLAGLVRAAPAPLGYGVASATELRRSADGLAVVGASVAALTALAAALVFGANLGRLLDDPERYGWPWDAAVVVGFGYGGADIDTIRGDLERREAVTGWSAFAVTNEVTVNRRGVTTIVDFGPDSIGVPVLEGRLPAGDREIALGRRTARELGAGVGDTVRIRGRFGRHALTVTGLVVLPSFGPFISDRAGLGTGALIPGELALGGGGTPGSDGSLIAMQLADGASGPELLEDLQPLTRWDVTGFAPFSYANPVRPPEIENVQTMRRGPVLVASLLGVGVLVALGLALAISVRARRRDLAVLRVVGFTPAQVRRSVVWQSVVTIGIGIVVGIPLGTVIGIASWRRFALSLGADPASAVPVAVLLVLTAGALTGAVLTGVVPGISAGRRRTADALRPGTA